MNNQDQKMVNTIMIVQLFTVGTVFANVVVNLLILVGTR
jgi:hypothetical protein